MAQQVHLSSQLWVLELMGTHSLPTPGLCQPRSSIFRNGGKVYHNLATRVPVLNIQGPQRTASSRNRPTPETPTLRQALREQTRNREGNPILPPDFFQFRHSTSYSMDFTHCSKNLVLNQWPQHRYLKEWAERCPKVACIHITLGRTDLHFKNGIRPCPLTYQWYHRRALSGSDTPIPIHPKLRTPTYLI